MQRRTLLQTRQPGSDVCVVGKELESLRHEDGETHHDVGGSEFIS
jgi:hypothetical protein